MNGHKRHTIRMTEATARRLKIEAAQAGLPQGALVAALLDLAIEGNLPGDALTRALSGQMLRSRVLPQG